MRSTGIQLRHIDGWLAVAEFFWDAGGAGLGLAGRIGTRAPTESLTQAVEECKRAAEALGVVWDGQPTLYVDGDGLDALIELPADWRDQVRAECKRMGWLFIYEPDNPLHDIKSIGVH